MRKILHFDRFVILQFCNFVGQGHALDLQNYKIKITRLQNDLN